MIKIIRPALSDIFTDVDDVKMFLNMPKSCSDVLCILVKW